MRRNRYSAIKAKIARRCGRIRANGSLQQLVPRANAFSWAQKGPPRESTKKKNPRMHMVMVRHTAGASALKRRCHH